MLWGAGSSSVWNQNVQSEIDLGSNAVLAYNEPDNCWDGTGACITVADAVAGYKNYMLPHSNVRLGMPAVTNGVGANIGLNWTSSFLQSCVSCKIDFVPVHWYSSAYATQYFKDYVSGAYNLTKPKPLWITEFGFTDGSDDVKLSAMKELLTWLDAQDYVERYAYFMASPGILLSQNGSALSELGQFYDSYSG